MRKLKPQQVGLIGIPFGGTLPVFLDRNELDFFAEMDGETWRAKTYDELTRTVEADLKKLIKLDWTPLIEIEIEKSHRNSWNREETDPHRGELNFTISRYYIALARKGWRKADWDIPVEQRSGNRAGVFYGPSKDFKIEALPWSDDSYRIRYWLAYNDELWAGLEGLVRKTHQLREQFIDLIGKPETHKRLTEVGASLLHLLPEETK